MLVGGAVVPSRQWLTLARCPLAGMRTALARDSERGALGQPRKVLLCEGHVAFDHPPDAELVGHREIGTHVVEERACRPREIAPVAGEAADIRLAGIEHALLVATAGEVALVLDDPRSQLAIDGAAEVVHVRSYPPVVSMFPGPGVPCTRVQEGASAEQYAIRSCRYKVRRLTEY